MKPAMSLSNAKCNAKFDYMDFPILLGYVSCVSILSVVARVPEIVGVALLHTKN